MRAKKATLAVHILPAKRGLLKGSEKDRKGGRERERENKRSPKDLLYNHPRLRRIRGEPSFDLCLGGGRGPAALRSCRAPLSRIPAAVFRRLAYRLSSFAVAQISDGQCIRF